jgi:hypothetical protein
MRGFSPIEYREGLHVETRSSRPMGPGVILGAIGGLAMIIGAFLTWVTVSLDLTKFASFLHVDPAALQSAVGSRATISVVGTKANAGKIVLALGVLCLVGVVLVFALQTSKKAAYAIVLVMGAAGAIITALQIATKTSQINSALQESSGVLARVGISADVFKTLFTVSWGIGLWVCIGGGVVAAVGGLIGLLSREEPAPMSVSATDVGAGTVLPGAMGTGFDAPSPVPPPPPAVAADPPPAVAADPPPSGISDPTPASTPTTAPTPAETPAATPTTTPPATPDPSTPPGDPGGDSTDAGSGAGVDQPSD